jgi:transcriptional regulator with XRE-family HTH domain
MLSQVNMDTSLSPSRLVETGRMLRQFRESKGWSLVEMSKKLGMREEQISAVEEGNEEHFKKNATQPLEWFARLYAKKLGVNLPHLFLSDIQRAPSNLQVTNNAQHIPAFLKKNRPL